MLEQQSILALLQTFEVTARHLSFTLAAHEMNLTQGAVSHRIRRLEMHIGFRLFIRMTRKLALTEEGKRLLATLSHSLRAINDEIEDIRDQDLRGTLHIGIAPDAGPSVADAASAALSDAMAGTESAVSRARRGDGF